MECCLTFIIGFICIFYVSGQTTQKVCWDSKWYNNSGVLRNRSSYEHQSVKVLNTICTNGPVIDAHCKDDKGKPFKGFKNVTGNNYYATCNPVNGLICHPYNNSQNATCPDFAIQYGCNCPPTTTTTTGRKPNGQPVVCSAANWECRVPIVVNRRTQPVPIPIANTVAAVKPVPIPIMNTLATAQAILISRGNLGGPGTRTTPPKTGTKKYGGPNGRTQSVPSRITANTQGVKLSSSNGRGNVGGSGTRPTSSKTGTGKDRGPSHENSGGSNTGFPTTGSGVGPSASGQQNSHCRNDGQHYGASHLVLLLCTMTLKVLF